jgi:hypothetical protein
MFCIASKAFYAIDARLFACELVRSMLDPQMFLAAKIHKPIIGLPAIRMNGRLRGPK